MRSFTRPVPSSINSFTIETAILHLRLCYVRQLLGVNLRLSLAVVYLDFQVGERRQQVVQVFLSFNLPLARPIKTRAASAKLAVVVYSIKKCYKYTVL